VEEINISINSEEAQVDNKTRKERGNHSMMVIETARTLANDEETDFVNVLAAQKLNYDEP